MLVIDDAVGSRVPRRVCRGRIDEVNKHVSSVRIGQQRRVVVFNVVH